VSHHPNYFLARLFPCFALLSFLPLVCWQNLFTGIGPITQLHPSHREWLASATVEHILPLTFPLSADPGLQCVSYSGGLSLYYQPFAIVFRPRLYGWKQALR